jgi:general secretion pathway protein G
MQLGLRVRQGFTLIEILLVVVIISVLVAMTIPNFAGKGEEARISAARTDIEANLATALDMYEVEVGRYPSTGQGLAALLVKPTAEPAPDRWKGPYLKKQRIPRDPWGSEYVYECPGTHNSETYDLASLGPDKVKSSDDVVNWEEEQAR